MPGLNDSVGGRECGSRVTRRKRIHRLIKQRTVRVTQQRDGAVVRHGVVFRASNELVKNGESVSGRTAAGTHDELQHAIFDGDVFARGHLLDVVEHDCRRDQPERIVVRARSNRADHFFGLGRRENELHVLGRLFNQLEQGIEPLRSDHVRLVEDEDLVPVAGRRKRRALAQLASIINTVVACGINLNDIHRAAAVSRQLDTAGAHATRSISGALYTVKATGKNSSGRRLAAATRTTKEIRVIHAIRSQGCHEWVGHLRLPNHFSK